MKINYLHFVSRVIQLLISYSPVSSPLQLVLLLIVRSRETNHEGFSMNLKDLANFFCVKNMSFFFMKLFWFLILVIWLPYRNWYNGWDASPKWQVVRLSDCSFNRQLSNWWPGRQNAQASHSRNWVLSITKNSRPNLYVGWIRWDKLKSQSLLSVSLNLTICS